jgi:heat shock protein HtpX
LIGRAAIGIDFRGEPTAQFRKDDGVSGPNGNRIPSYRLRNLVQTTALLGAMVGLLALLGWLFAGVAGVIWAAGMGIAALTLGARASGSLLLRLYRARPIGREQAPDLYGIADELAGRAGLREPPILFYIPSRIMQAFTVPSRGGVVISVTDGLLRGLAPREIAAVLAHEMSHVRHHDIGIMALADMITKLTRFLSFFGVILVLLNLPSMLAGKAFLPWTAVFLLVSAPTLSVLMQLALSRTREFDADAGAVELCGDPEGLAAALVRLERYQGSLWTQMLMPGYRLPEPSMLRSHPLTEERVRRLAGMRPGPKLRSLQPPRRRHQVTDRQVPQAPRWRRSGFWY